MFPSMGRWFEIKDGDPRGKILYDRHYSRKRYVGYRKTSLFVGPGEKMVLLTVSADALFVWKLEKYRNDEQTGVNCSIFRNEGDVLSSELIKEAVDLAWRRWPNTRLFTFVRANKIKSSNPGFCFQMAGWRKCGTTKGGLVILEICP
jgi:hypothetical protein